MNKPMSEKTLVIVPCGQKKIWDRHPDCQAIEAKKAYTGPPFKLNRQFAEKFGDSWVILSAKYGFVEPSFLIDAPYNVTFKRKSSNPVDVEALVKQVKSMKLDRFGRLIGLGGKEYREAISSAFETSMVELAFPFAGLPIGKMMQATKRAIHDDLF